MEIRAESHDNGKRPDTAVIGYPIVVYRTMIEDQMLRDELPGYADYAAKVRYRLIPGIW